MRAPTVSRIPTASLPTRTPHRKGCARKSRSSWPKWSAAWISLARRGKTSSARRPTRSRTSAISWARRWPPVARSAAGSSGITRAPRSSGSSTRWTYTGRRAISSSKALLRRRRKLRVRPLRLLSRRHERRRGLTGDRLRLHVVVDGLQVPLRHVAQREPRHRRARLHRLRALQPVGFGHVLHVEPEIDRVCRAPRPAPAELVARQPLGFGHLARARHVARGVAVVAARDLDRKR